ncbi:uncharacterized protein RCO7_10310 [Rhynchosporium graminicola]|uniref:Uncharacterized protein n=1 Tax=Rhynchosporium graminicola TaxID=2792576 RepID=A0A1E1LBK1_9HELO|nr:uncharacterized protein RCO7_10310 [Rhynchosporium commune]
MKLHNHVPAKISQECLDLALRSSRVSARQLLNGVPELTFPDDYKLDYLHGLHRIEAAREFLSETDKWWTVDLYLSDLDTNLETCLIEEYSNEEKPSDGEIYRKIRQYKDNFIFRQRWQARLKKTRAKDMTTLLRNEELTEAFDSLLPIYGLWDGMKLTTIHKITPMRCPELITNYLEGIKRFYSDLVEGDEHAMQKIDPATVKAMELRAPRASTKDAKFLYGEIHGARIFSAFSDPEREEIWRRLQMFEGLVPSLGTFFNDVLYLELLVDSVRRLTQIPNNASLIEALQKRFTGVNQEDGLIRIQSKEDTFVHWEGNRADQIDYGIRQLFAFAMREYPSMPRERKGKDLLQQPRARAVPSVLHCFADLASDLGFASNEIKALKQLDTDTRRTYPRSRPILVTSGPGVALSVRCGKPRCRSFEADRNLLFIDHLHDTRQDQGDGITSFYVRKSVYLAFFGRPSETDNATNMGEDTEDADSVLSYYHRQDRDQYQETSGVDQNGGQTQASTAQEERRQEQRRQEQELQRRLEQERLNQERLDQETLELERLERELLERERLEQAELERVKLQERLNYDALKRKELEQEKREQQRQEQLRQEEELQTVLEEERLQRERLERDRLVQDQHEQEKVEIRFKEWKGHCWKALPSIYAHPEDSSEVERIAKKYIRKRFRIFNTELQMLAPRDCFQDVANDRTHTVLLVSQDSLCTDNEMEESAKRVRDDALRILELKRTATDEISKTHHARKRR